MSEVGQDAVDGPKLALWLHETLGTDASAPLQVELISGGRSNLTFGVAVEGHDLVLRRPPLGHVLPTAHDMAREFEVLRALRDTDVPVPRVEAMCEDPAVLGAPFYVMQRVHGRVLRTSEDVSTLQPAEARALSLHLAEVLASIHAVDVESVGLSGFGRADGYLERQVNRWATQWEKNKTREIPHVEVICEQLRDRLPRQQGSGLVHGDYRIDNLILGEHDVEPIAVLDWEMSTLGDPLADLGLFMVYWADQDDHFPPPSVAQQMSAGVGFLSRDEMAEAYAVASGRDVSELPFYVALGYFKLAVILEGIHKRHLLGQTLGEGFDALGAEVPRLIDSALAAVEEL